MGTRVTARVVVVSLTFFLVAAADSNVSSTDSVLSPPDKAGKTPREKVPIVYDMTTRPAQLTAEQCNQILDYAEPLAPKAQRVWYIQVSKNTKSPIDGNPYWKVTLYFTPETATKRLRKGKGICVSSDFVAKAALLAPSKTPYDYVMVSLPDDPFGNDLLTPSTAVWPFARPSGFTDEEIIEVVDFARFKQLLEVPPPNFMAGVRGSLGTVPSVLAIGRDKDGTITVYFCRDEPGGPGYLIKCKRTDGKLVYLGKGDWYIQGE